MEAFSVVGFVEALAKIPAHYRLLNRVKKAFNEKRYDLVILVDYPGYHLRAASAASAAGIPVLYYIAPQMWAWGAGRVRRLAPVKRLAVLKKQHASEQYTARKSLKELPETIARLERRIAALAQDMTTEQAHADQCDAQ